MKNRKNSAQLPVGNVLFILIAFVAFVALGIFFFSTMTGPKGNNEQGVNNTDICFNEIMTSNKNAFKSAECGACDWMEIFNKSNSDADISGYAITIQGTSDSYIFPAGTVIKSKAYIVICCGKKYSSGLCTAFNLSKSGGETLVLNTSDGSISDTVTTVPLDTDISMIRDTSGNWNLTDRSTPGFSNDEQGRAFYEQSLKENGFSGIYFNEIMAKNDLVFTDEDGDYTDWIEIKNTTGSAIDLKGYTLTNSSDELYKWTFPSFVLQPGQCTVIFASGKDRCEESGELHTNFKLRDYGETLILCDASGHISDTVTFEQLGANQSFEKTQDGFFTTFSPTPGYDNTEAGRNDFAQSHDTLLTGLVINEAISKNTSFIPQNGGSFYDWVEVKNISDSDIDISEYCLSDDPDELSKWYFPAIILKPGEYFVVICSGSSILSNSKYYHTNFKINGDEEIFLSKDGVITDGMCLKDTTINMSKGRRDGTSGQFYFDTPTPGKTNNSSDYFRSVTPTPVITTSSGIYNDKESVTVYIKGDGDIKYSLYYSEDGGETSLCRNDIEYDATKGITLTSTAVVRAYSTDAEKHRSAFSYASYIINEGHSLPVVSIALDYDDMWDYNNGIYVEGPNPGTEEPFEDANYWEDWEKEGMIQFFADGEDGFSLDCGIKIFGAYSRSRPKKSFLLKFRDLYGTSSLEYDVFGNDVYSFKDLVLRSGSQDDIHAMVRDEWLTSLIASTTDSVYVQAYRPVVLYINGAYWGVYYIREKINADYVSKHLNVSESTVNLLESNYRVVVGSNDEYKQLLTYVKTHDMSVEDNYNYIADRIDIIGYIDYKIAEIYSGNQDTGNIKYFMSEVDDGKWHWIYYDLDWAFYYYTPIEFYTVKTRAGFAELNTLCKYLLNNDTFKDLFLKRFAFHLKNTYSYDYSVGVLDELVAQIEPEMARNCERWNKEAKTTYVKWVNEVELLRSKIRIKLGISKNSAGSYEWSLYTYIKSSFNLSDQEFNYYFSDLT